VRARNTGMQCYMNGRHQNAELDKDKRRDLYHKQEIGSGGESFRDPGALEVA